MAAAGPLVSMAARLLPTVIPPAIDTDIPRPDWRGGDAGRARRLATERVRPRQQRRAFGVKPHEPVFIARLVPGFLLPSWVSIYRRLPEYFVVQQRPAAGLVLDVIALL